MKLSIWTSEIRIVVLIRNRLNVWKQKWRISSISNLITSKVIHFQSPPSLAFLFPSKLLTLHHIKKTHQEQPKLKGDSTDLVCSIFQEHKSNYHFTTTSTKKKDDEEKIDPKTFEERVCVYMYDNLTSSNNNCPWIKSFWFC